jgi:hypothetical protein
VPATLGAVREISCGSDHIVAIKADGSVVAWGSNAYGQSSVPTGLGPVLQIAAGRAHTAVLSLADDSCRADISADGTVNGVDLAEVLTKWGVCQ